MESEVWNQSKHDYTAARDSRESLALLAFPVSTVGIPGLRAVSLCPVFKVSSLLSQIHLCLAPGRILVIGLKVHLTNPGWCRHVKVIIFAKVLRIRVWAVFTASSQCAALWALPGPSKPFWRKKKKSEVHLPDDLTRLKIISSWVLSACEQNVQIVLRIRWIWSIHLYCCHLGFSVMSGLG